jgi:putative peptide zinc metalloprotease protein
MDATRAVPRPAEGLEIGEQHPGESGVVVQLASGRHFEVSREAARLLSLIDGRRDLGQLAALLAASGGDALAPGALREIIERTLVPAGLVGIDEAPDAGPAPRSILWLRATLLRAAGVRRLAPALVPLFTRQVATALVAATLAAHAWFFLSHPRLELEDGLIRLDLWWPPAVVFLLSNMVHELGHAAALMGFGQAPGAIGLGLYLIFPVLYTDVDRAWRLPRLHRAVVDVGGIYVQMLFAALVIAWYALTHSGIAARSVLLIDLSLLANLNPFLRMDGYWLAADLSNTRELRRRAITLALGLFGRRARDGEAPSRFLIAYTWLSLIYFAAFAVWLALVAAPRLIAEMRSVAAREDASRLEIGALLGLGALALIAIGATLWVGGRSAAAALIEKDKAGR